MIKHKTLSITDFGNLFNELVNNSSYTVKEVCDYAGINSKNPSLWCKGEGQGPTYQEILLLADKLGVSTTYLIFGCEEAPRIFQ